VEKGRAVKRALTAGGALQIEPAISAIAQADHGK
jgi:hypothetical protein